MMASYDFEKAAKNAVIDALCECENCGCRFSYEKKDIKKDKLYARGELMVVISYVDCPHCGMLIFIRRSVIRRFHQANLIL